MLPPHKIIRSSRRTIALVITPDAILTVHAPLQLSVAAIEDFVVKKAAWIHRKIKELKKRTPVPKRNYENGARHLYLGQMYKIRFSPRTKEGLIAWYTREAEAKVKDRVLWHAARAVFKYKIINITNAKKRWGSCSTSGSLNFTWRLIMAPLDVIDYVVIHELVHINEKNHSKNFWNIVKNMKPHYKKNIDWLKANAHKMTV